MMYFVRHEIAKLFGVGRSVWFSITNILLLSTPVNRALLEKVAFECGRIWNGCRERQEDIHQGLLPLFLLLLVFFL